LAANAYWQMRKVDALNHWTYIRQVCPELCTLHSVRLFPDDKFFVNLLHFLHEKAVFENGAEMPYEQLIKEMSMYVATKTGYMYPHVLRSFQEERTDESEGYKNIIDGLLSIRLGCVIHEKVVYNVKLQCAD
tara:strand:+ start:516 stop:911 length:396 start_codon:yes stop_codon:yes gene_type:complete